MPAHDWTRADDGTFHAFHRSWIEELYRALNRGLLPDGYYSLLEHRVPRPILAVRAEAGDRLVAVIEVVSRGNKASRDGIGSFLRESAELLGAGVHLALLDPHAPGPRDPAGLHNELWDYLTGRGHELPADAPQAYTAWEADAGGVVPYAVTVAAGGPLPDLPLFLRPGGCVELPLEATATAAFAALPARRRALLEPAAG